MTPRDPFNNRTAPSGEVLAVSVARCPLPPPFASNSCKCFYARVPADCNPKSRSILILDNARIIARMSSVERLELAYSVEKLQYFLDGEIILDITNFKNQYTGESYNCRSRPTELLASPRTRCCAEFRMFWLSAGNQTSAFFEFFNRIGRGLPPTKSS